MKHPHTRCERRFKREVYIAKRKFIQQHILIRSRLDTIPHLGEGYRYYQYIEYLEYQALSEEQKHILEVEAILDHKEFEPPYWSFPIYGKGGKSNLVCGCSHCKGNWYRPQEKAKRRAALKKASKEGLKEYYGGVAQPG